MPNGSEITEQVPGVEPTEEAPSGQPETSGGDQPGGDSQSAPGSGSDKPVTQEAINRIYREKQELKEQFESQLEQEKMERAFEREQFQAEMAKMRVQPIPGKAGDWDDLPPNLQKALAQNPELAGSLEFVKAVVEAKWGKKISDLEGQLGQRSQAEQREQVDSMQTDLRSSMGSPILKEMGLNPAPDSQDEDLAALASLRTELQMPSQIRQLWTQNPNHPLVQNWWPKTFRMEVQKLVQKRDGAFESRHKAKLEELRKTKGATPPGGGGPSTAPEDPAAKQVKDAFSKGGKAVKELRNRIFGGDED